ncbi:hypothetical protein T12_9238 [Trichinella patagoniensis]|uniref:Uncharacterized protein n=1 Tax=Trichinella patagoniensis TaxID=990121 RepID=A0A0V0Z4W3_9BILA|nr:hypothetical protein T12_9238 [Trichinella patagoniensis]
MSHSIPLHILIHGRVIFQLGNTTTHCGDHVALLEEHKRLDNVNKPDSFLNDFV